MYQMSRSRKTLKDYGLYCGQTFGRWTINDEDLYFHSGRMQVKVKCFCGNYGFVRHDRLLSGKSLGCKKCQKMTNYPDTRISSAMHYNGLRYIFLNRLKREWNLHRGKKNISIDLTIEDLYYKLISQNFKCALSGELLNVLHIQPKNSNASIDRIDSNQGYTYNNIQWVTKDVNKMKNDFNQEYFIEICNKIAKTQFNHGNPDPSIDLNDQ